MSLSRECTLEGGRGRHADGNLARCHAVRVAGAADLEKLPCLSGPLKKVVERSGNLLVPATEPVRTRGSAHVMSPIVIPVGSSEVIEPVALADVAPPGVPLARMNDHFSEPKEPPVSLAAGACVGCHGVDDRGAPNDRQRVGGAARNRLQLDRVQGASETADGDVLSDSEIPCQGRDFSGQRARGFCDRNCRQVESRDLTASRLERSTARRWPTGPGRGTRGHHGSRYERHER